MARLVWAGLGGGGRPAGGAPRLLTEVRRQRNLEDEGRIAKTDGPAPATTEPAASPELPVVIHEPVAEPEATPPETGPLGGAGEPIEYAGVADDGVEVLYVGEAAVEPAV